jgi:hypothetical protein
MSDTNTATVTAPALPIRDLIKKDETGAVIVSITPTVEVVKRGAYEGNPFVTISVTRENLNDYVKFRGIDSVLDVLNAKERIDAQEALNYVATQQEAEFEAAGKEDIMFVDTVALLPEDKKPRNKAGEIIEKFMIDLTKLDIDRLYQTLLEGKVRGGLTIKTIEEEMLPDLMLQMQEAFKKASLATTKEDKIKWFEKSGEFSVQYSNLEAEAARIRAERKPRAPRKPKTTTVVANPVAN